MQLKVGDTLYDDATQPMMVILTDQDKKNIHSMLPACSKYAVFPGGWDDEETMRQWMRRTLPSIHKDQMQTAFNNAINFALDDIHEGEGLTFLTLWREGAWLEIAEQFPKFVQKYGLPE